MRRRSLPQLLAVALASWAALWLLCSSPEVRAWSAGIRVVRGLPRPPNHDGDLAQRAVKCMDGGKTALSGCRINLPVDPDFQIAQVRRGAQTPDFDPPVGDGADSSRH